jgi:hypothetical protein
MRKIKRITHLKKEQRRLRRREAELEKAIRGDWKTIRQTLEPAALAKEAISSCTAWIGRRLLSVPVRGNKNTVR